MKWEWDDETTTSEPNYKSEHMIGMFFIAFVNSINGHCSKKWLLDHESYSKDNVE